MHKSLYDFSAQELPVNEIFLSLFFYKIFKRYISSSLATTFKISIDFLSCN